MHITLDSIPFGHWSRDGQKMSKVTNTKQVQHIEMHLCLQRKMNRDVGPLCVSVKL
jgi:hypothetical protein